MDDFKFKIYFNQYKNISIVSFTKFKRKFIKQNGDYKYLKELYIAICNYQRKTYGEVLDDGKIIHYNDYNKNNLYYRSNKYKKFGSREDMINRKLRMKK